MWDGLFSRSGGGGGEPVPHKTRWQLDGPERLGVDAHMPLDGLPRRDVHRRDFLHAGDGGLEDRPLDDVDVALLDEVANAEEGNEWIFEIELQAVEEQNRRLRLGAGGSDPL